MAPEIFAGLTKDTSSSVARVKGIDFRYGGGGYHLNDRDELSLLKHLANDQNNYYLFDNAGMRKTQSGISDIYVGFVLVPSYYIKNKLFYREEFRIGLSYSLLNNSNSIYLTMDTVQTTQQKETHNFDYQYRYRSERVHFSYLLNSRISKRNIACYAGLGTSFGFVTWSAKSRSNNGDGSGIYRSEVLNLQNDRISGSSKLIPLENFSTQSLSLFLPLGIKYNLSCDLNLFAEVHLGYQYYLKGLRKDGTWIPNVMMNFGFRYKLIDDEAMHKGAQVFW